MDTDKKSACYSLFMYMLFTLQANRSHDNGVPASAVCEWLKDEERLHDSVDAVDSTDRMKRKNARTAKDPQLEGGAGRHPN